MENTMKCPCCGEEIPTDTHVCNHCDKIINDNEPSVITEALHVACNATGPSKNNGIGMTGFIFSLISLGLSWLPGFNIILWVLSIVFSSVGLSRRPKCYAVAGLIISSVVSVLIVVFSFLLAELLNKYVF